MFFSTIHTTRLSFSHSWDGLNRLRGVRCSRAQGAVATRRGLGVSGCFKSSSYKSCKKRGFFPYKPQGPCSRYTQPHTAVNNCLFDGL